jgi:hypothetical protein
MLSVKELIKKFDKRFSLNYYDLHFEKIEININKNPDVSIEICKSLIEGISKTIINFIGIPKEHKEHGKDPKNIDSLQKLVRLALDCLCQYLPILEQSDNPRSNQNTEISFLSNLGNLVQILGNIRSERGDISHGKPSPKILYSDPIFSKTVYLMTEGIIFYILSHFLEVIQEIEDSKIRSDIIDIVYDEYIDFNQYLDEQEPMKGVLRYSKALYEQDYFSYVAQLEDFKQDLYEV